MAVTTNSYLFQPWEILLFESDLVSTQVSCRNEREPSKRRYHPIAASLQLIDQMELICGENRLATHSIRMIRDLYIDLQLKAIRFNRMFDEGAPLSRNKGLDLFNSSNELVTFGKELMEVLGAETRNGRSMADLLERLCQLQN